ncbi:MAG: DUF1501 domain-containing protein [Nocardioidaceae bacterium]
MTTTPTTTPPGCEGFHRSLASRRSFLKGLGAVTAGGVMATMHGTVFRQTAFAATGSAENILVVLSQRGGADGMSMVVPYGDLSYTLARPLIGIPATQLLQTDGMFGLHPHFAPLEQMWKNGTMAAVHAVGMPAPNRSHFDAIIEVEEADPGSPGRIGWLNRMVGMSEPGSLFGAVQIGDGVPHTEIYGSQATLSATEIDKIQIYGPVNALTQRTAALNVTWNQAAGPLGEAGRRGLRTAADWRPVLQTSANPQNGAVYPKTDLGDALAQSARLIRADVGAEVITVDHSSWDMHTDLGTLADGNMNVMIDDLAGSIAGFFADLGPLAANVTLITISEFGRRVVENGDAGLDHGYGNAMLLFGAGVKGGSVYGTWPGLRDAQLRDGDLDVTTDYRSVLSEVVKTRFTSVSLPTLFPGFAPERVGVMLGA